MKRRAKAIIFFISILAAMMFAAMSVNAEVIRDDKKPATIIAKDNNQTKAKGAVPKIKTVYNGNEGLTIKVPRRNDVWFYNIYRRCSDDNINRDIGWVRGAATDIIDTSVRTKWGKTYTYTLVAYFYNGGTSSVSNKMTYVRVPPVKYTAAKAESVAGNGTIVFAIGTGKKQRTGNPETAKTVGTGTGKIYTGCQTTGAGKANVADTDGTMQQCTGQTAGTGAGNHTIKGTGQQKAESVFETEKLEY